MSLQNSVSILEDHKYDLENQQYECQLKIEAFEKAGKNIDKLNVQFEYLCKAIESTEDEIAELEDQILVEGK